jgi:hypothetical protein
LNARGDAINRVEAAKQRRKKISDKRRAVITSIPDDEFEIVS